MAEFFEVQIVREDESKGVQYINIESIAYAEVDTDSASGAPKAVRIYLNNGYWFTVVSPRTGEVLQMIKDRIVVQFKSGSLTVEGHSN